METVYSQGKARTRQISTLICVKHAKKAKSD